MKTLSSRIGEWLPPLKWTAALFFLNALLSLEFPSFGMQWVQVLRASPEVLFLLLGMCLLVRNGAPFRALVYVGLTATVMFLRFFLSADRLVPMIFNRTFNLLLDSQRLPDFFLLFWQTRPAAHVLTATAGILLAAAALAWGVWRALKTLHLGLAQSPALRRGIRLPVAAVAAAALAAAAAGSAPSWLGISVMPRVLEELRFILNLDEIRKHHQSVINRAKMRALHTPTGLEKLKGAAVFLVVVESYGMSAFCDPRHAGTTVPAVRAAEADLRAAGFEMCSAYLSSPTFGGGSWLAHASLASGVRVDGQIRHDMLLASDLVPLAEYFNRAGYRTVRAMPGTLWPWSQGAFYRYQESYHAPDYGYRGPSFGFAPMPDQFVLDWTYRRVIRNASRPLFIEFILTGSHAAFDVQAPFLDDWERIGDGSVFRTLPPVVFPIGWSGLSQASEAYSAAIVHEITLLKDFICRFLDGSELIIILGDHQPCGELIGDDQPWSVPVHVISGNPDFIREFERRGYSPGMLPDFSRPHGGMEVFFWEFLEGFSRP